MRSASRPARTGQIASPVPFGDAVRVWVRVALNSFGGPAGQIAVMHRILVEERRWLSERRFLHALNYCMLLPGPEAQQLATYVGWLLHGTRGGLVAGGLFILPGFVSILVLSVVYTLYGQVSVVTALFFGLKAAVLAVVVEAMLRIGRRALKNGFMMALAALAFVAIFVFEAPFPLIVAAAALVGLLGGRLLPDVFLGPQAREDDPGEIGFVITDNLAARTRPNPRSTLTTVAVWLAVWLVPLLAVRVLMGSESVFVDIGVFFSKAAVVTFGGAYAVLAYLAQQAVDTYGWLRPGEMLDGLGLAETTPGPLIQVVQFVGFLAAYRFPGELSPLVAGVLGSVLTAWATFVPCFLWIFTGAPYIEALRGNRALGAALSAITAAVVGVVLNLALWFALHVLFTRVDEVRTLGARLLVPDLSSLDPAALAIAALAFVALLRWRLGMISTLAASAAAGVAFHLLAGG